MTIFDIDSTSSRDSTFVSVCAEASPPRRSSVSTFIRNGTSADIGEISRLFRDTYGSSSHPYADEYGLGELMASGRTQLLVAVDKGQIAGCVAANRLRISGVREVGSMVVGREHSRFRLANQLATRVLEHLTLDPDCQWIVAFVRGLSIHRLANHHPLVPMKACGHDGAMNIAQTEREHHVVTIGSNPHASIMRARPVTPLAAIERVLGQVPNLCSIECDPGEAWAAPSLWPTNPETEGSKASCVELNPPPAGGSADDALAWIASESAANAHVPHQFLFATFDTPEFVQGLQQQGFQPTAYMPAWAPDGTVRRDCVLMVKRHADLASGTRGFDSIINAWNRRLRKHMGSAATAAHCHR